MAAAAAAVTPSAGTPARSSRQRSRRQQRRRLRRQQWQQQGRGRVLHALYLCRWGALVGTVSCRCPAALQLHSAVGRSAGGRWRAVTTAVANPVMQSRPPLQQQQQQQWGWRVRCVRGPVGSPVPAATPAPPPATLGPASPAVWK
jgi:hypothetical protein